MDYPKAVGEAFGSGKDEFQSGIMDVGKGKFATGLGKEAVGMLGMAFSPISAALDEFIEKPVAELTGSKAIGDRVADTAGLLLPGGKRAEEVPKPEPLRAKTEPLAETPQALERADKPRADQPEYQGLHQKTADYLREQREQAEEQPAQTQDSEPVIGYTTAKGSTYQLHEDGTTTRNKAARNDPGHEGDSGAKPRTAKTVYVDSKLVSALSAAGLTSTEGTSWRVALRDGKATLISRQGKDGRWGASEISRDIPFSDRPEVGKAPLELWKPADDVPGHEAYRGMHAGNEITELKRAPGASKAQSAGAAAAPEPSKPGTNKVTHEDVLGLEASGENLRARSENRKTNARKELEAIPEGERGTPQERERIYAHMEGDTGAPLTPREREIMEKYNKPLKEKQQELWEEVQALKPHLSKEVQEDLNEHNPNYVSRIVQGMARKFDKATNMDTAVTGGGGGRSGVRVPGSAKERSYYTLESPDGHRMLVHKQGDNLYRVFDKDNETLIQHDKSGSDVRPGQTIKYNNKDWKLDHARTSEIEANTDLKYYKDDYATRQESILALQDYLDQANFVKNTKAGLMQKGWGATRKDVARAHGYKEPKFPGFANFYVEPRLAAALDKFAPRAPEEGLAEYLQRANDFMNRTMFVFPFRHAENVAVAGWLDRGLKNYDPRTYGKLGKYIAEAYKDVFDQTKFAQDAYEAGAGFWRPSQKNAHFYEQLLDGLEKQKSDPGLLSLERYIGSKPGELLSHLLETSHNALGVANDVVLLARVKEKMADNKGMSLKQAVREVHETIASYRIPSEIVIPGAPGRAMSQALQGKYASLVVRFTRYHYGNAVSLVSIPANVIKGVRALGKEGLAAKTARRRATESLAKAINYAVAYNVIAGIGDPLVQAITGDSNSRMPEWGPLAYIRLADDMVHGRLTTPEQWANALLLGVVSPSPLASIIVDAFRPKSPGKEVQSVAEKAFQPMQQIEELAKGNLGEFALDVLGLEEKGRMNADEKKAYHKTPEYKEAHPKK